MFFKSFSARSYLTPPKCLDSSELIRLSLRQNKECSDAVYLLGSGPTFSFTEQFMHRGARINIFQISDLSIQVGLPQCEVD